ncbi:MAG: sugar phosphate isomerase/epimerase [Spirochaetales bacterium]|nr:sugar phosphate isomerase/epimerase [Spirochaetales bacterium]
MIIKKSQIAAQMYTVRDFLKKPADIKTSLKKVKKMGYEAVELAGLGPIKNEELKKMLDGEGLVACSTHGSSDDILNKPSKVVDTLQDMGISSTVYPHPSGIDFSTLASVKAFAKKLDKSGAVFNKAGLILAYHNHHIEFRKIKDKTVLELIYELTDPANLKSELDTHWVQAGGGDIVAWIKMMKKRLPLLHLKDYGVDEKANRVFKEIGSGNLTWEPILKAAKASGCKWYVVEQDSNFLFDDPFKSLRASFKYLSENFCV